jgi:outer membrane protein assembly factor BamE (lipoprotein component of BamABCDE complex)
MRPVIMNTPRLLLTLIAATALLAACTSKLTNDNLNKIKTGMTQVQVKEVLGTPSRSETGSTLGVEGATFYYSKSGTEVKIVFLNDAVILKSGSFQN